jgi:hypothetical protein
MILQVRRILLCFMVNWSQTLATFILQGVDMQLGLAVDSPKATLAVKRRLACEMVKYWNQIQESIPELTASDGWGKKHLLFVKWKYVEAKVCKSIY